MKVTPYGYVYQITNLVNGKIYIGQRKLSHDKSWRGYMGSGEAIRAAIVKYGKENFVKSFIAYAYDSDELTRLEDALIVETWEKLGPKNTYNLGRTPPADTVRRLSKEKAAERSHKLSAASKAWNKANPGANVSAKRAANFRKEFTLFEREHKETVLAQYAEIGSGAKVAETLGLSRKWVERVIDNAGIERNSRTSIGFQQSEETKEKIRQANLERHAHLNKECEWCGASFRAKRKRHKTCSRSCGSKLSHYTQSHS